jgi:hypothetical protein
VGGSWRPSLWMNACTRRFLTTRPTAWHARPVAAGPDSDADTRGVSDPGAAEFQPRGVQRGGRSRPDSSRNPAGGRLRTPPCRSAYVAHKLRPPSDFQWAQVRIVLRPEGLRAWNGGALTASQAVSSPVSPPASLSRGAVRRKRLGRRAAPGPMSTLLSIKSAPTVQAGQRERARV